EGPRELKVGPEFIKAAFALTPDTPFSEPIVGVREGAVYVMALLKRLPSEVPTLDAIREQVTMDFRLIQAADLARKAGAEVAQTIAKAIADGKTFDAAAEAAKLKVVQIPPFSLSSQEVAGIEEHISLNGRNGLKEVAFSTAPGKMSGFRPTA